MNSRKSNKSLSIIIILIAIGMILTACSEASSKATNIISATATPSNTIPNVLPNSSSSPQNMPSQITSATAFVGTTSVANTIRQTPSILSNFQTRWLKGIPCNPPCWEGITPGKTSLEEALKLLKQMPEVKNPQLKSIDYTNELYITWNWAEGDEGGELDSFSVPLLERNPNITYSNQPTDPIILVAPVFSNVKLGEIIKAYGEPTYILTTIMPTPPTYFNQYYTLIVYEQLKISLELQSESKPIIDNSLELHNLKFFDKLETIKRLYSYPYPIKYLIPWDGFKTFDFYCRNAIGNNCQ